MVPADAGDPWHQAEAFASVAALYRSTSTTVGTCRDSLRGGRQPCNAAQTVCSNALGTRIDWMHGFWWPIRGNRQGSPPL